MKPLKSTCSNNAIDGPSVFEWHQLFSEERERVEDD